MSKLSITLLLTTATLALAGCGEASDDATATDPSARATEAASSEKIGTDERGGIGTDERTQTDERIGTDERTQTDERIGTDERTGAEEK